MSKFPKFQVWDSVRVTHPGYWFDKVGTVTARDADGDRCYVVSFPDRAPANFTADELILADVVEANNRAFLDGLAKMNAAAEEVAADYMDALDAHADAVSHPPHYTSHPSGIECIQITEHMGFNLGNAVKYVWRADLKDDAIQDLKKARWYIDRELAKRKAAL